ncbi:MAG: hypothetical protein ACI9D4_001421 [Polaribacter sp.]
MGTYVSKILHIELSLAKVIKLIDYYSERNDKKNFIQKIENTSLCKSQCFHKSLQKHFH